MTIPLLGDNLAYKTTYDKAKAITNITLRNTSEDSNPIRMVNIRGATYCLTRMWNCLVEYGGGYEMNLKYNVPKISVYCTTSTTEGDPIKIDTLKLCENLSEISEGYTAAAFFIGKDVSKVRGNYIVFPGEPFSDLQYISSLSAAVYTREYSTSSETMGIILGRLAKDGNDNYINYDFASSLRKGYYIGYTTTDDIDEALTGILLVNTYNPQDTYAKDGIVYKISHKVNLNGGTIDADYSTFIGTPRYLYYTKDPEAGAPITSMYISSDLIVRDGSELVISDWESTCCLQGFTEGFGRDKSYLHIFREKYEDDEDDYEGELYVNEVFVGYGTQRAWMRNNSTYTYFTYEKMDLASKAEYIVDFDMSYFDCDWYDFYPGNCGVYVAYNKTKDKSDAVTGLLALQNQGMPETYEHNGITYYLVSDIDFNKGHGGNDIFLYYTKDPAAGVPIVDLCGSRYAYISDDPGYEAVKMTNGRASNMNQGNEDSTWYEQTYLMFKRGEVRCEKYISYVNAANNSSQYGARDALSETGCQYMIEFDFNIDTGDDYVFIGYNRTSDVNDAITGLLVSYHDDATLEYNGVTYYLASGTDLNANAGGEWMFLYYTKDPKAGDPILALCGRYYSADWYDTKDDYYERTWWWLNNSNKALYDGSTPESTRFYWDTVRKPSGGIAELNEGTGAEDAFLMFCREVKTSGKYLQWLKGSLCADEAGIYACAQGILTEKNLNENTKSDYCSYMSSFRTDDAQLAITGITAYISGNVENDGTWAYNGFLYYPVDGCYIKGSGSYYIDKWYSPNDFKVGTGGEKYVYLYYTKDSACGEPITDYMFSTEYNLDGWNVVLDQYGTPANFNAGYETEALYMLYKTDASFAGSVLGEGNVWFVLTGTIVILGAGITAVIVMKKRGGVPAYTEQTGTKI